MTPSRLAEQLARAGAPIVVATHPRSGTHLAIDLLRWQFADCRSWKWPGQGHQQLYLDLDSLLPTHHTPIDAGTALAIVRKARRPILKTHALPGFSPWRESRQVWTDWIADGGKCISVYRDGRDVMSSYFLSCVRNGEVHGQDIGPFLRQCDHGYVPDPIVDLSRTKLWAHHVECWRAAPNALSLKYERLVDQPADAIEQLGGFLGLEPRGRQPLLPPRFNSVLQSRLSRVFGWCPPSSALISPMPQRRQFKWIKMFTRDDRAFFDAESGDVLRRLGYVKSSTWVNA